MSHTTHALEFWKQHKGMAITTVVLICLSVLAFGSLARDHNKPVKASEKAGNGRASMESESVTVTGRGFEPAAITRTQGKFILVVDNRSGTDLSLRFSRETGESVHEIRSSRDQLDWNEVVDLKPGRYVLTEVNHPSWACSVVITAN